MNKMANKHRHYYKDVSNLEEIDIYDVCNLFKVNDSSGCIQHAIKKLLCAGQRGTKSTIQDYREAMDSIDRKIQLLEEEQE